MGLVKPMLKKTHLNEYFQTDFKLGKIAENISMITHIYLHKNTVGSKHFMKVIVA